MYSLASHDSVAANDVDDRLNPTFLGVMGGLNLPVVTLAEHLSLGINPNLGLATPLSDLGGYSSSVTVEAPLYLTLKYGTDATWDGSRTVIGASAGVGYQFTLWAFSDLSTVTYGMPSIFGELNFGKRRSAVGLIKLRYSLSLGSHNEEFVSDGDVGQIVFTHHSFHLLFTPGY
jgi:hypothetical protein